MINYLGVLYLYVVLTNLDFIFFTRVHTTITTISKLITFHVMLAFVTCTLNCFDVISVCCVTGAIMTMVQRIIMMTMMKSANGLIDLSATVTKQKFDVC